MDKTAIPTVTAQTAIFIIDVKSGAKREYIASINNSDVRIYKITPAILAIKPIR